MALKDDRRTVVLGATGSILGSAVLGLGAWVWSRGLGFLGAVIALAPFVGTSLLAGAVLVDLLLDSHDDDYTPVIKLKLSATQRVLIIWVMVGVTAAWAALLGGLD